MAEVMTKRGRKPLVATAEPKVKKPTKKPAPAKPPAKKRAPKALHTTGDLALLSVQVMCDVIPSTLLADAWSAIGGVARKAFQDRIRNTIRRRMEPAGD